MRSFSKGGKLGLFVFCLFFGVFLVKFASSNKVFADYEYGYGGGPATGGVGDPNDVSYYDCINGMDYCPRWIKVPSRVYKQLVNKKRMYPIDGYVLPECRTDKYVVIAGRKSNADQQLIIHNFTSGNRPMPYKEWREYVSTATSLEDINNGDNFFDDLVEDGSRTYATLLDDVIKKVKEDSSEFGGLTDEEAEQKLAVFCLSMVQKEPEILSVSNVLNSGLYETTAVTNTFVEKSTSEVEVKTGDSVRIVFSHNLYSRYFPMENVKWKVKRNFPSGGGYVIAESHITNPAEGVVNINKTTWLNDFAKYKVYFVEDSTMNGREYLARDVYDVVTFDKVGSYRFCETMIANDTERTRACTTVVVKDEGIPSPPSEEGVDVCKKHIPDSYIRSKQSEGMFGATRVLSLVRNNDGGYGDWVLSNGNNFDARISDEDFGIIGGEVYAKPNDNIEWLHCYYPGVQETANMEVRVGHTNSCPHTLETKRLRDIRGSTDTGYYLAGEWENKFEVTNVNLQTTNSTGGWWSYEAGNSDVRSWGIDNYRVQFGQDVSRTGMTLTERIESGAPTFISLRSNSDSWCCGGDCCEESGGGCCCVSGSHSWKEVANYNNKSVFDIAKVKVPYNFVNKTLIKQKGLIAGDWGAENNEKIVYAGESVALDTVKVSVESRNNAKVKSDGGYATKVDNAEIRLFAFTSSSDKSNEVGFDVKGYSTELCKTNGFAVSHDNCVTIDDVDGEKERSLVLNPKEETKGVTYESYESFGASSFGKHSYNVFDAPAGEYFCVALAVYPASVISDTDIKTLDGISPWVINSNDYSWRVATDCLKIAKKPSFEVWGGNVYSFGKVQTYTSPKKVVKGRYDYTARSANNTTVFGSWVELGMIANNKVEGLASGASTAGWGPNSKKYSTFDNFEVGGLNVGGSHEGGNYSFCNRIPLTIPNAICSAISRPGGDGNVVNRPSDKNEIINRYIDVATAENYTSDITIGGLSLGKNDMRIINAKGHTVTITNDIVYQAGSYTKISEIPKYIVYAQNINIQCNVGRIDAVLIADGTVDTCSNANETTPKYNGANRATKLVINGTVIANDIVLGRTYGAATGVNSGESAEVINYDTSLYLWGRNQADVTTSGKLNTLYTYELAPRY